MAGTFEENELKDRLNLIESMIAEGRRKTEHWGWTFVLWGVAYYVAIAWSTWGSHVLLAWPVTMIAAALVTGVIGSQKSRNQPETTLGRAIGSVWTAMGISLFLLLMSLGYSGKLGPQSSVAIASAILGMTNATSGMILRWKMQMACALVWWAAAVAACFGSASQSMFEFLIAVFFCQIVFGVYAMVREAQRARQGAVHA